MADNNNKNNNNNNYNKNRVERWEEHQERD